MIRLFERSSTKLTISEFYENHQMGKYVYDVAYQRESGIWSEDSRAFLIDSIFKNYPMPPIFMKSHVDTKSGKTVYDIVDGKQRLETILAFIDDGLALTAYFADDSIFTKPIMGTKKDISGLKFSKIKGVNEFDFFVRQFWTYSLDIEYLYEDNPDLIANVFDRLNRGGERLRRQELRNAKFHSTKLLKIIQDLAALNFWVQRYRRLKVVRMEEVEFISELFFLVAEGKILDSNQTVLDALYKEYESANLTSVEEEFIAITNIIDEFDLDYDQIKRLDGTTHLYGLFSVAWYCYNKNIDAQSIKGKLQKMYTEYFGPNDKNKYLQDYKKSCSSRTKSKDQRRKRMMAVLGYCGINIK